MLLLVEVKHVAVCSQELIFEGEVAENTFIFSRNHPKFDPCLDNELNGLFYLVRLFLLNDDGSEQFHVLLQLLSEFIVVLGIGFQSVFPIEEFARRDLLPRQRIDQLSLFDLNRDFVQYVEILLVVIFSQKTLDFLLGPESEQKDFVQLVEGHRHSLSLRGLLESLQDFVFGDFFRLDVFNVDYVLVGFLCLFVEYELKPKFFAHLQEQLLIHVGVLQSLLGVEGDLVADEQAFEGKFQILVLL